MAAMLSWHKVGQKVTMKDSRTWNAIEGTTRGDEPQYGRIYSIDEVCCVRSETYFRFQEVRAVSLFDARSFVPVYPTIVEQLRDLKSPRPARVREEA